MEHMKKTIARKYAVELWPVDNTKWVLSIVKVGADFKYLLEREGAYNKLLTVYRSIKTVSDIKRLSGRDFVG
ncbi:MAG: hypothetical protein NTX79_04875 [Candidatus Micrarchaeota archaeon]|nr:hypothetical protein [Candidatus Micrarchaeota archaeon]